MKAYRARQKEKGLIRCDVWVPVQVAEAVCDGYGLPHYGHHIGRLLTEYFPEISDAIKRGSATRGAKRKQPDNLNGKKRVHTDTPKELNCDWVEIPDKDGRCMAQNVNRSRCHHKGAEWQPVPNGYRPCEALFCKKHSQIIDDQLDAVCVHSSCLR